MQILLITPFYRPGVGGSSRLLQSIVDHLIQSGQNVTVLTYGFNTDPKNVDFDSKQPYTIIRIKPINKGGLSSLTLAVRAVQLVLTKHFNLIFCGVAFPHAIIAYALSLISGIPYAVYSHGEDVTCVKDSPKKRWLLTKALTSARMVMTNSNHSLRAVRALSVPESRSTWMPPSIDTTPYTTVEPSDVVNLKQKLDLPDGPLLLTVARLIARKGHDTVVRAMPEVLKAVPNAKYVIVGDGDQTVLRKLAAEHDVEDAVLFINHISEQDLPALYHLCDVYVMTSRWDPVTNEVEGFGMVYLEAGASGKPCIAGSDGGCPDAIVDGLTGYVVSPLAPDEISAALIKILSDPSIAQKLGQAGQEYVEKNFTRHAVLPKIEKLLIAASKQ